MMHLDSGTIYSSHNAVSRSLTAENVMGEKGKGGMATPSTSLHPGSCEAGRELGTGWKLSPCISIAAGETATLMDHEGPGVIRHIWMTHGIAFMRDVILRVYWEGQNHPSIEAPLSDFMCQGWSESTQINAIPFNVNSGFGMNCFLPMPFRKHARITVQNDSPNDLPAFFYTINYTLEDVPEEIRYLHACWRRENPTTPLEDYTILEGVEEGGQYVGTFMCWQQNSTGWWGEGEIKMYLDGDEEYPTICGTGTEDYFGGAWGFHKGNYSAPYMGYQLVKGTLNAVGARYTLYRFHLQDPIYFQENLRVTMQCLGWRSENRYLPLQDDVSSVAYWYQSLPGRVFPPLPDRDRREVC